MVDLEQVNKEINFKLSPIETISDLKIMKRNGSLEDFDVIKVYSAMLNAAKSVYVVSDDLCQNLACIARQIELHLREVDVHTVTISMIQALVEDKLLSAGYLHIAEHYISYRLQRDIDRTDYAGKVVVHLKLEQVR